MKKASQASPNQQLADERNRHNWSQQEVADKVGTTPVNVSRWERGITFPNPYFRRQLCLLFEKNAEELGLLDAEEAQDREECLPDEQNIATFASVCFPDIWNVPYRRNPFFTGREEIITHLYQSMHAEPVLTYAISGLGGIGKTQLAIEYAYRYRDHYQAVFWVQSGTLETLTTDFVSIATLLHIDTRDATCAIEEVKSWLDSHGQWLLILDDVKDIAVLKSILPFEGAGHILITTQMQSLGILAGHLDLDVMSLDESMLFLLRRAKLLACDASLEDASETMRRDASSIAEILGRLPLALDQAGAYIEETGCGLLDYVERYQREHAILLALRGKTAMDHPASVNTTFSLCIAKVEQMHAAAADFLRSLAFLPEKISEEAIIQDAQSFGPDLAPLVSNPLTLDAIIASLRVYSLVGRCSEAKILTLHRLLQTVLKDNMGEKLRLEYAKRLDAFEQHQAMS